MIPHIEASEVLTYRDWQIEIHRKGFRRSISIVLKPGRPVRVNVGKLTSLRTVLEFLESRADWVDKHLTKFAAQDSELPSTTMKPGEKYPYMGRQLTLKLVPTPLKRVFASIANDELLLHIPSSAFAEAQENLDFAKPAIRELYKSRAQRLLQARTAHWAQHMGLQPSSVHVREAKTRWGSCNRLGKISLNWRMIVFDEDVIDYVIVHELSHLKHLNHSKNFWDLVFATYPAAEACMKRIKQQHRQSDFLALKLD